MVTFFRQFSLPIYQSETLWPLGVTSACEISLTALACMTPTDNADKVEAVSFGYGGPDVHYS